MHKNNDLRNKDVIDANTAERLGRVYDIDVDLKTGRINSLVIPSEEAFIPFLGRRHEIIIPWSAVLAIGSEFILVRTCDCTDLSKTE